jgi:hypothetical protein
MEIQYKGGNIMKESVMKRKKVLGLGEEPGLLMNLEEEISGACPECWFDKATNYDVGVQYLASYIYDLVILDFAVVRALDLLDQAAMRNFPTIVLLDNGVPPEALKRLGVQSFFPKDRLKEIVPSIEGIIARERMPKWKRSLNKLGGIFGPGSAQVATDIETP